MNNMTPSDLSKDFSLKLSAFTSSARADLTIKENFDNFERAVFHLRDSSNKIFESKNPNLHTLLCNLSNALFVSVIDTKNKDILLNCIADNFQLPGQIVKHVGNRLLNNDLIYKIFSNMLSASTDPSHIVTKSLSILSNNDTKRILMIVDTTIKTIPDEIVAINTVLSSINACVKMNDSCCSDYAEYICCNYDDYKKAVLYAFDNCSKDMYQQGSNPALSMPSDLLLSIRGIIGPRADEIISIIAPTSIKNIKPGNHFGKFRELGLPPSDELIISLQKTGVAEDLTESVYYSLSNDGVPFFEKFNRRSFTISSIISLIKTLESVAINSNEKELKAKLVIDAILAQVVKKDITGVEDLLVNSSIPARLFKGHPQLLGSRFESEIGL